MTTVNPKKSRIIEYYFFQVAFFVLYLPFLTIFLYLGIAAAKITNFLLHGMIYFSFYGAVCIFSSRVFPLFQRKTKYIVIVIPIICGVIFYFFLNAA